MTTNNNDVWQQQENQQILRYTVSKGQERYTVQYNKNINIF